MNQREDEREGWPVKPYYKRDLAVAYAPDITPVAALNRLSSWVHHHKVLYRALADSGGSVFPVFGKAVGTDPVSVRMSASRMLATRTYA